MLQIHDDLSAFSPENANYLQTIEAAAFVINLDEGSPTTFAEQGKQSKFSDGFNRWHDKGIQIVVTANGNSSLILEHSCIDGTAPSRLHVRIRDAIRNFRPSLAKESNGVNGYARELPQELLLTTTQEIEEHINVLRERWLEFSNSREFVSHKLSDFGGQFILDNNVPIKAAFDIMLQLVVYLFYGSLPPNWQPVSLTHYHMGRHDMVQVVSPAVKAFCEAAADDSVSIANRRSLMMDAALDLNARMHDSKDGKAWYRLYTVIEMLWPADKPKPALYNDPLQRRIEDFSIVSIINGDTNESVKASLNPDALRLKYSIQENE